MQTANDVSQLAVPTSKSLRDFGAERLVSVTLKAADENKSSGHAASSTPRGDPSIVRRQGEQMWLMG